MRERRLALLANEQHNIFTRQQARDAGFPDSTIHDRVRGGQWIRIGRGVLMIAGATPTRYTAVWAAVLELGRSAVVGRMSAGALYDLCDAPSPPQVNIHESDRVRSAVAADVFITYQLDSVDVTRRRSLPVTTIERTLVDLAGSQPRAIVEDLLDTSLRRRLTTIDRIEKRAAALRERGRAGPPLMMELLSDRSPSARPTESVLEDRWERIARGIHSFAWERQFEMTVDGRAIRVDFISHDHGIIVETDGWATHGTRRQFEADARRRTALSAQGYIVLVFTWNDITRRPDWVATRICEAMRTRAEQTGS